MPTYQYTAVNALGKTVRGKLTASNELDLEERLKELHLDLIEQKISKSKKIPLLGGRIKVQELIMMCIHISQLDKAGVPILDSLADLRDSTRNPALRDLMSEVYEDVKGGTVLSEAMRKHDDVFGEVFTGLVAAGERTGNISEAFNHLSNHLKWNNDLRRKIKKAVSYPIVLLLLMTGVITLMMMFVVPQLSEFLSTQGFELPIYTHALIWTSQLFDQYWYLLIGGPMLSIVVLLIFYKTSPAVEMAVDALMLKLPFVGPVVLKSNLSRFSHFFAITFSSGIGVLECLETAAKVTTNKVMQRSIREIIQNVADGSSMTQALVATQRFPSLVIRMFKVGEESGDMDSALHNINFFYEREVNDAVDSMVGMIQPALTIVMGLMMFWVTAAVFGPLYDSFSKMQF